MANNNRNSSPIIHECLGLIEKLCTSTIGIYVQLVLSSFHYMDDLLLECINYIIIIRSYS